MVGGAKYREICETLKSEILGGKYASCSFPSSTALAHRFKSTRFTIRQALDRLVQDGLVVSRQGRGTFLTRQAASRKIGLIVPALPKAEIFSPICHEISAICQENDRLLFFADEREDVPDKVGGRLQALVSKLIAENVAGIIFHPVDYCPTAAKINHAIVEMLNRAKVPVVLLDCDLEATMASSGLDLVGVDNIEIGWQLGRHVMGHGAKRILFLMRTKWSVNVWKRLLGLKSAAEGRKDVRIEEACVELEDRVKLARLLKRKRPDAVVCSSDGVAAVALKALASLGRRVPEDVLMTGVNDVEIARVASPALTTVRQPCAAIARAAYETLEWRMRNPTAAPRRICLTAELVVRESTEGGRER